MKVKAKIEAVNVTPLPDGPVEFRIQVHGKIKKAEVFFDDGAVETMELEELEENPVLFCEHIFKHGSYVVTCRVYDENSRIHRHLVNYNQA